jgi:hypothetical protein
MVSPNLHATVDGDMVTYEGPCVVTKEIYKVTVPKAAVDAWNRGMRIQVAMPGVSPGDREFLMSGISPTGWDWILKVQRM